MARYGQVLLRRLTFQYCDRMGCSVGVREYIQDTLPAFAEQNPHIDVLTLKKRNKFPLVKAEYALLPNDAAHLERVITRQQQAQQQPDQQGQEQEQEQQRQQHLDKQQQQQQRMNSNVIGLKSCSPQEIQELVWWLTQSQCRPRTSRIPVKHVVSKQRSIQGSWTATTF